MDSIWAYQSNELELTPDHLAPDVPGLDYQMDLGQVKDFIYLLLKQTDNSSMLVPFIENRIIKAHSGESFAFEETIKECQKNEYGFSNVNEQLECLRFIDDLHYLLYKMELTPQDRLSPVYRQFQILVDVFAHSPWREDEYPKQFVMRRYTWQEAYIVYKLFIGLWSHTRPEAFYFPDLD